MKKIPDIQAVCHCGYVEEGKWLCGTKAGTGACIICLIKRYMFKPYTPSEVGNFVPYCILEKHLRIINRIASKTCAV